MVANISFLNPQSRIVDEEENAKVVTEPLDITLGDLKFDDVKEIDFFDTVQKNTEQEALEREQENRLLNLFAEKQFGVYYLGLTPEQQSSIKEKLYLYIRDGKIDESELAAIQKIEIPQTILTDDTIFVDEEKNTKETTEEYNLTLDDLTADDIKEIDFLDVAQKDTEQEALEKAQETQLLNLFADKLFNVYYSDLKPEQKQIIKDKLYNYLQDGKIDEAELDEIKKIVIPNFL